jgi:hypothetical protein
VLRRLFAIGASKYRAFPILEIDEPLRIRLHDLVQVAVALQVEDHVPDAQGVKGVG